MTIYDPTVNVGDIDPEGIEFLWEGRFPRGLISAVAGMPGQGKSLFAYFLASEVSKRDRGVIFVSAEEDAAQAVRPRMDAAGTVLYHGQIRHWDHAAFPADAARLHEAIRRHGVDLVVIDPVTNHVAATLLQPQAIRAALMPLQVVARETGAAIVLVIHTVKRPHPNAHPQASIPGANGGLLGLIRQAFIFGPDPDDDDQRLLACVKNNYGPEPPTFVFSLDVAMLDDMSEVAFLRPEGETAGSSIGDARLMLKASRDAAHEKGKDSRLASATEWLVNYLRLGSRPVKEIKEDAERLGHKWSTIRRASDDLEITKPKGGPGSTWTLPDGYPADDKGVGDGA